ncbi:ionotropic receptor 75a [Anabrus simplex]|uniref:ionotropic receptor 75a n=1 Tax=Anabrus simplex TaxID=316456 RepID=UPI0035A2B89B
MLTVFRMYGNAMNAILHTVLSFSFDVKIMDTYGWQVNGTFDGLMGLLQRKEVEIAASALFMRHDRMKVLDFAAEAFYLRTAIMFRQPTLSSMSNIFVMPFSNPVWVCCGLLCIITVGTFGLQVFSTTKRNIEKEMTNAKWMDIVTFVLGAICQQGAYMTPTSISARITMFIISLASLFLFTSYSANIVALLQTPSNAIKTITDLVNSPIKLGLQDVIYNRVYLKESTDTETRHFYLQKVAPFGEKVFHNVSVGMQGVRQGMYAFQVDRVQGYKEISDTYTEREKCGLKEIELFPLAPLTVATGKHSGLREMFAQRVRWQREVGIFNRLARVWLPQKPVCENRVSGFVSVGIMDFYPALLVLQYGIVASIMVFFAELLYFYRSRILKLVLFHNELPKKKTSKKTKAPAKAKTTIAWVD